MEESLDKLRKAVYHVSTLEMEDLHQLIDIRWFPKMGVPQ